jgi:hypothetical protein
MTLLQNINWTSLIIGTLACGVGAVILTLIVRPIIQRALVKKNQDPKVSVYYLGLAFFVLLFAVSKFLLNLF